jgi:outer membrane protein TolC
VKTKLLYPALAAFSVCFLTAFSVSLLYAVENNGREEIALGGDNQQAVIIQEIPRQKESLPVKENEPPAKPKPKEEPARQETQAIKIKEIPRVEEAVRPTASTPLSRMISKLFQYPKDAMEASAKDAAIIGTFGGWINIENTQKRKFNREIGFSDMKTPEEKALQVFTLKECLDIAIKNHLPLVIAKKGIRLAELRIFEARRNLLPTFTIGYEETTGRVNARAYIHRQQYVEGQQPIFHGGDLYCNFKQTETNLEITKNDYNRIKNELVLQVKKGYYSFAKSKENLKFQRKLSEDANTIYETVKKQYEYNIAPKLEFLNVSSQTSQIKYQLASAEGDVKVAELILKQAMNINSKDRIDVIELLPFKKIEIDYEHTLRAAMFNRPEMKINSLMIEYYNYGKGIARAKGLPKIDLLGQWGLSKDEYASPDQNPGDDRKMTQQWYAGLKASIPFWGSTTEYSWTKEQWAPQVSAYSPTMSDTHALKFKVLDKLDNYSDLKLAEIDYDKAMQEFIKIKQDVTLEVQEGCFNYDKAVIQLETAAAKLEYQSSDLEVNRMRRGLDEIPDSAVIESMIKLAQERFGYMQALSDCYTSRAALNKAVGIEDYYKEE